MRHSVLALAAVVIVLVVSGCGSGQRGRANIDRRNITIVTEPPGATVYQVNPPGQPLTHLGNTPLVDQPVVVVTDIVEMKNLPPGAATDMLRRAGGNVVVTITREGYQKYKGILPTKRGETLVHTIALQPAEEHER